MTEPLDEDEQAWLDLYDNPPDTPDPLADHGRPAGRPHLPHDRPDDEPERPVEDLKPSQEYL